MVRPVSFPLVFIFLRRYRNFEFFCLVLGLMEHPFNPQYNPVLWEKGTVHPYHGVSSLHPFILYSLILCWEPSFA